MAIFCDARIARSRVTDKEEEEEEEERERERGGGGGEGGRGYKQTIVSLVLPYQSPKLK